MHDWQDIVTQHGRAVYDAAWRLLGNDADAHDCAQETFVAAVEFARCQPVKNWRALLHRLVTSKGIDMLRRNMRLKAFRLPVAEEPAVENAPIGKMQEDELVDLLRAKTAGQAGRGVHAQVYQRLLLPGDRVPDVHNRIRRRDACQPGQGRASGNASAAAKRGAYP